MNPFSAIFKPEHDLAEHFREISEEIVAIARKVDIKIIPYRNNSLPIFSKLNEAKKLQTLKVLSHQRDFMVLAESEGLPLKSPQLIWRALAKMGMTPQPDIFDKITPDDTVEVYHWDSTTSFKNLVFFEFISMSLEEVYCTTWMEQINLSPKLFLFFLEMNAKVKLAMYTHTFEPKFNRYEFTEKMGEKRHIGIHLKWISPITHQGEKKALLFVNRAKLIKKMVGHEGLEPPTIPL